MNHKALSLALVSSLFCIANEAIAEHCTQLPVQPIPAINNKCPSDYNRTNGYCVPNKNAMPVLLQNSNSTDECPTKFVKNNGFCRAITKKIGSVIPPITEKCPIGYIKFGNYCRQSCFGDNFWNDIQLKSYNALKAYIEQQYSADTQNYEQPNQSHRQAACVMKTAWSKQESLPITQLNSIEIVKIFHDPKLKFDSLL